MSQRGIFGGGFCIVWLTVLMTAKLAMAQAPSASVRGQVTDPSGASIAGATMTLTTPSGKTLKATTDKEGTYEFKNLAAGKYGLNVSVQGFTSYTQNNVVVTAGQATQVNVQLTIEEQQQQVEVQSSPTQLDVSPENNANVIVLQEKDLQALSDDPDELLAELQALAGPSPGPMGGQIYIDGFTAGQLPPKASIREIRLNQNPFSAEYDKLGYGRIEVFTKPGTDKFHGQFMVNGNASAFNSRNPFAILPEGTAPPSYHSELYAGSIGGPINSKASFFFNIEQREIGELNVVNATVLCGSPYPCPASGKLFSIIPFSQAVANPQSRTNLSPRIDYQLTPNNVLMGRYQFWRDSETNNGIGQFNLAETGNNELSTEHTLQLTDTQTVNPSTINEVRFQYIHDNTFTAPLKNNIMVTVDGAFNGFGSGGGNISDKENRYEGQEILYKNISKHAIKIGGRIRSTTDMNSTATNFTGLFTFGSRQMPGCTVTPTDSCVISGIQAFQITEQGLADGLTIPEIETLGGGPSYYSQTAGIPLTTVTVVDGALFYQDDWSVRPNFTVSYGARFETQNNLSNKADIIPRLGLAYGIGGSARKPPKTVVRAGFGTFYDRFTYNLLLPEERFNIFSPAQQQYLITNPNFFLTGNPGCVPPIVLPPPAGCTGSAAGGTIHYEPNANLHAPYTIQTGVTAERQLTRAANIAFTYLNSRGVHQYYLDNINPPNPAEPVSTPPNPLFQYESEGIFKQNQFIVNGRIMMGANLSLFGYYTLNYANSDTAGPTTFISIPGQPSKDYGRASYDIRNRVFLGGAIGLPRGFRLNPFLIASSGIPFNITTGTDPFQDENYNVRPAFAPCNATAAIRTKYGCFVIPTDAEVNTYTPIPTYYGNGPGRFSLNLRLSKTIGFGPQRETASNASGGPSQGTFGGGQARTSTGTAGTGGGGQGPGGGGGGGGGGRGGRGGGRMGAASSNRRYSLTFGVSARNIFNNVNVLPPVGVLNSPLFGQSNGLAGRPYNDPSSNRRFDLQLTFAF
jgi:Carboxypeptidase regulatory-like domain